MKCNLEVILKAQRIPEQKERVEMDLKDARKTINKLLNSKNVNKEEIDLLHQTIESIWYGEYNYDNGFVITPLWTEL